MRTRVVAALPNAGLANKLFVWARAEVFAHLNGLSAFTVGWHYPKPASWSRGRAPKRNYSGYFQSTAAKALLALGSGFVTGHRYREPVCRRLDDVDPSGLYVFRSVPHWKDMFADIRAHRNIVRSRLQMTVRPEHWTKLAALTPPMVAVHVRRGDFRQLQGNEDFSQVGGVRTPESYFLTQVLQLREAAGYDVPVTVFSDGTDDELAFLLKLPRVARSQAGNDLLDLLLLSQSRVIIASAGSTYSDWAGYLSEAVVVRHPDHIHSPIRPAAQYGALEGAAPHSMTEWRRTWETAIGPCLEAEPGRL
jgi:hypothetical protein